jgi:hypothetical protein
VKNFVVEIKKKTMPFLHYKYIQGYSENPAVFIGFICKYNGENATNFIVNFSYCNLYDAIYKGYRIFTV